MFKTIVTTCCCTLGAPVWHRAPVKSSLRVLSDLTQSRQAGSKNCGNSVFTVTALAALVIFY